MNWQAYWNQLAQGETDLRRQVARVSSRRPLSDDDTAMVVDHLRNLLDLQPHDRLLDLCCGNGLLTYRFARHCKEVVGIDLAHAMITSAETHSSAENIEYFQGNVTEVENIATGTFDKILLQFSFQYLTRQEGALALKGMRQLLKPGGTIVLGDVPDRALIRQFYPSLSQLIKYRLQRWLGRDQMGKFWSEKEMQQIAAGMRLEKLSQPAKLPYSDYRVDYRLS